jgi:signal transduction histidine kinase/DNA-binding NarL/FixJ family response regulator
MGAGADDRFLRAILRQTGAVLAMDTRGSIRFASEGLRSVLGVPEPAALVGDALEALVPLVRASAGERFVTRAREQMAGGKPASDELLVEEKRILRYEYTPLRDEDGTILGHRWSFQEPSARKSGEFERAQDGFVAAVSHELRSPLHVMLGVTEMLLERARDPGDRELIETLLRSGRSQLNILNDLLDFSKFGSGNFELAPRVFRPADVVRECLKGVDSVAERKGLTAQAEMRSDLEQLAFGDPDRIRQVLTNLLTNAVKFTEQGGVIVRARLEPLPAGGSTLRVDVFDSGVGVPPDEASSLFQSFRQGTSGKRKRGGTGLGLYLSRQLAISMGGDAGYTPNPRGGSVFWFTVHLGPVPAGYVPAPPPRPSVFIPQSRRKGATVLLVEDTDASRLWARRVFESHGYSVIEARDGLEAIEVLGKTVPDVVIMDWNMPLLDGREATRRIRKLPGPASTVPILGLTASALASDRDECLSAGMNACLFKPISAKALLRQIDELVSREKSPPSVPAEPETAIKTGEPFLGLPPKVFAELVDLFVTDSVRCIEQTTAALSRGDRPALARALHALAGLSGNLRQAKLYALTRSLEQTLRVGGDLKEISERVPELTRARDAAEEALRTDRTRALQTEGV